MTNLLLAKQRPQASKFTRVFGGGAAEYPFCSGVRNMKKKISLLGIVLGFIAGAFIAMLAGSWIFWLSVGLAIGVVLGTAGARHTTRTQAGNSARI
jgi:hypothetical protein